MSGAAYVFRRSGTEWSTEAFLKPPKESCSTQTMQNEEFGYSVGPPRNLVT